MLLMPLSPGSITVMWDLGGLKINAIQIGKLLETEESFLVQVSGMIEAERASHSIHIQWKINMKMERSVMIRGY